MSSRETATRRVSIAGRVTDALTGLPLAGARVVLATVPRELEGWLAVRKTELASRGVPPAGMPDAAATGGDGWFHFDGLPDGKYGLEVSLPSAGTRYAAGRVQVKLKRGTGPAAPADASVALAPTAVAGVVRGQDGAPLTMAELRVKGSGEKTFSDAQGRYRLSGIERGTRTVVATARGMAPAEAEAALPDPGSSAKLDFVLRPAG